MHMHMDNRWNQRHWTTHTFGSHSKAADLTQFVAKFVSSFQSQQMSRNILRRRTTRATVTLQFLHNNKFSSIPIPMHCIGGLSTRYIMLYTRYFIIIKYHWEHCVSSYNVCLRKQFICRWRHSILTQCYFSTTYIHSCRALLYVHSDILIIWCTMSGPYDKWSVR